MRPQKDTTPLSEIGKRTLKCRGTKAGPFISLTQGARTHAAVGGGWWDGMRQGSPFLVVLS